MRYPSEAIVESFRSTILTAPVATVPSCKSNAFGIGINDVAKINPVNDTVIVYVLSNNPNGDTRLRLRYMY